MLSHSFNTTWEEDFTRYRILRERKITPFVMIYNKGEGVYPKKLGHFARWVNAH